jgi:hypothetical protein
MIQVLHTSLIAVIYMTSWHVCAETTEEEIKHLLTQVEQSNCVFIRNGTKHKPADAADHLRLKYRRGKAYVGSAEQFIDHLASESSWTGKPYTVQCPDRDPLPTREWLHDLLQQYRKSSQAAPGSFFQV